MSGVLEVELWKRWEGLGTALPREMFEELTGRYSGRGRAYHNLRHLAHCLEELAAWPGERWLSVELAL